MDRFQEMLVFRRVVEAGNVTRAAEALHVSQPALSRTLAGLEARLGVELLRRTKRGVQPTEAGQAFFRDAVELLDRLDDVEANTTANRAALAGTIRLATATLLFTGVVAPILGRFVAEHSSVSIDAAVGSTHVDMLADNIDLALRGGRPGAQDLKFRKLGVIELALFASPDYLARAGTPTTPEELADHTLIGGIGPTARAHWPLESDAGQALSIPVALRHHCDDLQGLIAMAEAGLGITFCPPYIEAAQRLRRVLPGWHLPDSPVFVVWPAQRHMPARVRALLDALIREVPALLARRS